MANTQRSLADVLALLPDNSTGLISPQDVRDSVVSIFANYATIGTTGGVTTQTTNSTPNTFDKVTLFQSDGIDNGCVSANAASNQIDVTVDGVYIVLWDVSFEGDSNTIYFGDIELNDAVVQFGKWKAKVGSGGDPVHAGCSALVSAEAGDRISASIACESASADFTPDEMTLTVIKIG